MGRGRGGRTDRPRGQDARTERGTRAGSARSWARERGARGARGQVPGKHPQQAGKRQGKDTQAVVFVQKKEGQGVEVAHICAMYRAQAGKPAKPRPAPRASAKDGQRMPKDEPSSQPRASAGTGAGRGRTTRRDDPLFDIASPPRPDRKVDDDATNKPPAPQGAGRDFLVDRTAGPTDTGTPRANPDRTAKPSQERTAR